MKKSIHQYIWQHLQPRLWLLGVSYALLLLTNSPLLAQSISGTTTPNTGTTYTYNYTPVFNSSLFIQWSTSHSDVTVASTSSNRRSAQINFGPNLASGTYQITVREFAIGNPIVTTYDVQVVSLPPMPNASVTFTQTGCTSGQLSYTVNPPTGINWYWQTTASGTSTTYPAKTFATSETTTGAYTYYLRAKEGSLWSATSQAIAVNYAAGLAPPYILGHQGYDPTTQTFSVYTCKGASIDLTTIATNTSPLTGVGTLPGNIRWFEEGQTIALNDLQTPALAAGQNKTYEVANYDLATQCVGARRKVKLYHVAPPLSGDIIYRAIVGNSGPVTVDVTADVIEWYADADATQLLATGNTLNITDLNSPIKTYYLKTAYSSPGGGLSGGFTCSSISPVEVKNYPRPTLAYHATFSNLDQFNGFVLEATNTSEYTNLPNVGYQWYRNGTPITGATQPTYTLNTAGNYQLKVTFNDPQDLTQVLEVYSNTLDPYGAHPAMAAFLKPNLPNPESKVEVSNEGCGQITLTLTDGFPSFMNFIGTSDDVIWYWQVTASGTSRNHPAFGRDTQGKILTNSLGEPIGHPFQLTFSSRVYLKAYDPINGVWSDDLYVGQYTVVRAPWTPVFYNLAAYCYGDQAYISILNHKTYEVEWYRNDQVVSGQLQAGATPIQTGITLVQPNVTQNVTYWARFKVDHGGGNICYSPLASKTIEMANDCNDRDNSVTNHHIRKKGVVNLNEVETLSVTNAEVLRTSNYVDGLGRSLQQVSHQTSVTAKDVVQPVTYDGFGRMPQEYLPYTSNQSVKPGDFRQSAITEQADFYQQTPHIAHTNYSYSQTQYEASPLSRVEKIMAPGESWVGNNQGISTQYTHNTNPNDGTTAEIDKIRIIQADFVNDPDKPIIGGYYAAGELIITTFTDEDGKVTKNYRDKLGQVVLERAKVDANTWAENYYVYNDLGQLNFVLPPEATKLLKQQGWSLSNASALAKIQKLWFQYSYDDRGRLIKKVVPGAGQTEMVYDARDRLVLTQDAAQNMRGEWRFMKYDYLNRLVVLGIHTNHKSRSTLQSELDANFGNTGYHAFEVFEMSQSNSHYYTNQAFPAQAIDIHSVIYYDNYAWKNGNTKYDYQTNLSDLSPEPVSTQTLGKVTGGKVKVVGNHTHLPTYLMKVNYYDERGRLIQALSENHKGGLDINAVEHAFDGRVTQEVTKYQSEITTNHFDNYYVSSWMDYDFAGRPISTYQQIQKGGAYTYRDLATAKTAPGVNRVNHLVYNEIGQVKSKQLGSKANDIHQSLQTIDYQYNIRGWLTHLNDAALSTQATDRDIFGFELKYNQGDTNQLLNGNIAQMVWKSNLDGVQRRYNYSYDGLDRLTSAIYTDDETSTTGSAKPNFDVRNITYDLNGNILTLERNGLQKQTSDFKNTFGLIDNLSYTYQGNQLIGVDDATSSTTVTGIAKDFRDGHKYAVQGQEYFYDKNGNLTQDKNKDIESITYNYMNLPTEIVFTNNRRIEYIYDGSGQKLSKTISDGSAVTTLDYLGGLLFKNDELQFIHLSEGRALAPGTIDDNTDFLYEYHYKDHLGNLRVAFREGNETTTQATIENRTVDLQQGFEYDVTVRETKPSGGGHAAQLSGETQLLGPWKTIKVTKGDQVSAEVYTHISGVASQNTASPIQIFVANLANVYNQNGETGINNPNLLQLGVSFSPNGQSSQSPGLPVAYLRYVFYNEAGVAVKSGRFFVSTLAQNGWERLHFDWDAPENGTLQIYTANETEDQKVWFDDLKITFAPQLIVQENHYYPFGMNLAGIEKKGQLDFKYQYNSLTEKETSFGLNWYETNLRGYDAQLGRFHQVDVAVQAYTDLTPYHYSFNNPISFSDPYGDDPIEITKDGIVFNWDQFGGTGSALGYTVTFEDGKQTGSHLIEAIEISEEGDGYYVYLKGIDVGGDGTVGGGATVTAKRPIFIEHDWSAEDPVMAMVLETNPIETFTDHMSTGFSPFVGKDAGLLTSDAIIQGIERLNKTDYDEWTKNNNYRNSRGDYVDNSRQLAKPKGSQSQQFRQASSKIKALKVMKAVGKGLGVAGMFADHYEYRHGGMSTGRYIFKTLNGAAGFVPGLSLVSLGLGVVDAIWGDDIEAWVTDFFDD